MAGRRAVALGLLLGSTLPGCHPQEPQERRIAPSSRPLAAAAIAETSAPPGPPPAAQAISSAATPAQRPEPADRRRLPSRSRLEAALAVGAPPHWPPASCATPDLEPFARCLLDHRWRETPTLHGVALTLWDRHQVAIGLEPEDWMDGGFRGRIHLVPEAPVGPHARHLAWVAAAHAEIAEVLGQVAAAEPARAPMRFRHGGIAYGFFRSVGRTTPSAYASAEHIAYNVTGSLHASADAVRDTLFHEIVHVEDGEAPFSNRLLDDTHQAIVSRCGTRTACLTPYAPTKTLVRGGTYYAFQPANGDAVHEYAAEVATRWFQEHRAALRKVPPPAPRPFKCGAPENARAWRAITGELFGGIDLIPACR